MGMGTDRGRENADLIRFEDLGKEVPRSTNVFDVPNAWTEIIAPVPKGHIYKVFDIDLSNPDTKTHNITLRFLNGGVVYYTGMASAVPLGGGVKLPSILIGIFGGNSDLQRPAPYFMGEGDTLEITALVAHDDDIPTVMVSYLDTMGGVA